MKDGSRLPFRHGSVTERLTARLDDLEPVVDRLLQNEAKLIADALTVDARIGEERTHRLKLAQEQRGYVDNEDRQLRQTCQERWNETGATHKRIGVHQAFVSRGFWSRLNWLLTGR
jgi:hypothetical protein